MKHLTTNILTILLILGVISGGCAGRKGKAEHRDLIPENDLVKILTDIYLADGLLSLPDINMKYTSGVDTLKAYSDIVEQHGYKQDQLDKTIRYYFVRNPKKLIKIYDIVLGNLSEIETRIEKKTDFQNSGTGSLWSGKLFYSIPDPAGLDSTALNFAVPSSPLYNLKFTLTIFPDDQTANPRPGIYLYDPDSISFGKRIYFPSIDFIKDGKPHKYKLILRLKNPVIRPFIGGWFIDHENHSPSIGEHIRVSDITLSRNPVE